MGTGSNFLVTGASKGIGRATGFYLAERGHRVFAGVRDEEDGRALRERGEGRIVPVQLDVTSPESIKRALVHVQDEVGSDGLGGLVNNAGIVVAGPLEGIPMEDVRKQFEVNVFGVLAVTQAFVPLLRTGAGRIVNVSSINGRIATPFAAPYAASKFALEALSDGFRLELRKWNIPVSVIQPGAVDTPIWSTSGQRAREISTRLPPHVQELYAGVLRKLPERAKKPDRAIPAERVAAVIYRALTARRPKTRYVVGPDARLAALLRKVLPDKALDRVLTR